MNTCAEQLPIEIWIMIFQYLEAHGIFQAFQNLNHYFNQILTLDHLLFYICLKQTDNNYLQYSTNPY
jgi:ABC-type polysaccharide transport system permease subunit